MKIPLCLPSGATGNLGLVCNISLYKVEFLISRICMIAFDIFIYYEKEAIAEGIYIFNDMTAVAQRLKLLL